MCGRFAGRLRDERIATLKGPRSARLRLRAIGRTPAQRTTTYDILEVFDQVA